MSDELWTDWLDHDGSGCPVAIGTIVEIEGRMPSGNSVTGTAVTSPRDMGHPSVWFKADFGKLVEGQRIGRVLRYRVRRYASADKCISDAIASAGRFSDAHKPNSGESA